MSVDFAVLSVLILCFTFASTKSAVTHFAASFLFRMEAQVQAYPAPKITWHVNGTEIKPSNKHRMTYQNNVSVLEVHNVTPADVGTYTCRAVSDIGEAVSSTTLYVIREYKRDFSRV